MVLDQTIKGVYAIPATPFHANGAVDWDSVDRLTDIMLNAAQPALRSNNCPVTGPDPIDSGDPTLLSVIKAGRF